MAGKLVNSSIVLLSKFGVSRQGSASKTATSHIRKTFTVILKQQYNEVDNKNFNINSVITNVQRWLR